MLILSWKEKKAPYFSQCEYRGASILRALVKIPYRLHPLFNYGRNLARKRKKKTVSLSHFTWTSFGQFTPDWISYITWMAYTNYVLLCYYKYKWINISRSWNVGVAILLTVNLWWIHWPLKAEENVLFPAWKRPIYRPWRPQRSLLWKSRCSCVSILTGKVL